MSQKHDSDGSGTDLDEVLADYMRRLDQGEPVDQQSLIAAHPELATELRDYFSQAVAMERIAVGPTVDFSHQATPRGALEVRCPNCHQPTEVAADTTLTDLTCSSCGSHFSLVDKSKATRMAPSLTKLGRFELIERLGVGGFGSVWKARDKELDRTVAIKIPRAGGMTGEEQEKFFREARAAAQLRHPSIVSVHEVGRDGDNVYIVSDFVRGVTLGDWLTGQQLTSREAAELCAKIADALHHAHEQGVVHRDLKPANIMIDGDGQPHLMDFGLARREVGEVTVTVDGQVLGTPAYMSPEQAQGEAHKADRRSDVYSLGVILFQLLTGELPFRGNARMLIHQVIHEEPPSPRKLNANIAKDIETITLKCLEKDPVRRYQSAAEFAAELRRYLAGEPIRARSIGRAERTIRWVRRNKTVSQLASTAAITLIIGTIVSTYFAVDARRGRDSAERAQGDLKVANEKLVEHLVRAETAEQLASRQAEQLGQQLYAINLPRAVSAISEGQFVAARDGLNQCPEAQRGWEWHWLARKASMNGLWKVQGRQHAQFMPDGRQIIAVESSDEKVVNVWNAMTGTLERSFARGKIAIKQTCLAPDGQRLAVGTEDGTIALWNVADGRQLWSVKAHENRCDGLDFCRDGTRLASASWDGHLKVFHTADGAQLTDADAKKELRSVSFHPDSKRVITASRNNTVRACIWDATSGEQIRELPGGAARCAAYSPDGRRVVVGGFDGRVTVFAAATGDEISAMSGHIGAVHSVSFSPDGTRIGSGGGDNTVRVWDSQTGSSLTTFYGHTASINFVSFSPDGDRMTSSDSAGAVHVWDTTAAESFASIKISSLDTPCIIRSVEFSQDGKHIFAATSRGELKLIRLATLIDEKVVTVPNRCNAAALSPNNKQFAGACRGAIYVWHSATGELLHRLEIDHMANFLTYSPNGNRLASYEYLEAAGKRAIRIWDVESGTESDLLRDPETGDYGVWGVAFRPDKNELASVSTRALRIWNTESRTLLKSFATPGKDCFLAVKYSPDGSRLVACGKDGMLHVWDAETHDEVESFAGTHTGTVRGLAFSPDGSRLVSGDSDGVVKLWNAATGIPVLTLHQIDKREVHCIAFSPDGKRIAAGSSDGTIALWEIEPPPTGYAARRVAQVASRVAGEQIKQHGFSQAAIAAIREDKLLCAEVKRLAGRIVEERIAVVRKTAEEELRSLRKSAEDAKSAAAALNEYAWALLTIEPRSLRDPAAALPVAERAVKMTDSKDPNILDTLAQAYFDNGEIPKAVEIQQKVVEMLPTNDSNRDLFVQRLKQYEAALNHKREPSTP